jgi:hypothetical protein
MKRPGYLAFFSLHASDGRAAPAAQQIDNTSKYI